MKLPLYGTLVLCAALASCGGDGTAQEAGPLIRFVGTYEPACSSCTPSRGNVLTIAPVAGARTLGSKDIAKVELSVDEGPVQVLSAPNSTNAAGQPSYVFNVPQTAPPEPVVARTCSPALSLVMTVTDVSGYSFRKSVHACSAAVFGAFSDYGDTTVTFQASASAPVRAWFTRDDLAGYVDGITRTIGSTTTAWTLQAREADQLRAYGPTDRDVAVGTVLSLSIEAGGGTLASSSSVAQATGTVTDTFLVCCARGAAAASAPAGDPRSVVFVVAPVRFGVVDPDAPPHAFNVHYRVLDPAAGTVVSEFRGLAAGYSTWPVSVRAGQELRLEASPVEPGTYVQLSISTGTGLESDLLGTGRSMGMAYSNRPEAPARLNVFCCTP